MNTGAVSKMLGVSSSTVQRWVKHLGLEMERNEFGHYVYGDEDIELLKEFKQQLQNGVPIQNIVMEKKPRKGYGKIQPNNEHNEDLIKKVTELEKSLENKADSVVTYQLLQHRNEIEELKNQIEKLTREIDKLTAKAQEEERIAESAAAQEAIKPKRKGMFSSIFGF